jgi:glycosyltransferase involved in cell wall biosynthesis
VNVLHAIHDFLPRHQAGSEIYAFDLCRELMARHHVTVLCADYDPARSHGELTWRVHLGLPVVEIVNNWSCGTFEESYRPPLIGDRIAQVLDIVQPDVVHVHNLLNLSFDLPAMARARGIPVVATLHDYTLVCPSGGQRLHRAEHHVCREIDVARCARCFPQSPFHAQVAVGRVSAAARGTGVVPRLMRLARAAARAFPGVATRGARIAQRMAPTSVTPADIQRRLDSAQRVFDDVDLFVAPVPATAEEYARLGLPREKLQVSDYGSTRSAPCSPSRGSPSTPSIALSR